MGSENEFVKVEFDVPRNIYKAVEYICNLGPIQDIKNYMIWCLKQDVECMYLGGWPEHTDYINNELKAILEG